jgi:hypothetical protein
MPLTRSPRPSTLVFADVRDPEHLVAAPCRARDRFGACLSGTSLDRRLAAGWPPESDRLLATRAQQLASPPRRRALATHWEHLLEVSRRQSTSYLRRVPLCRDRISAAEEAVREMVTALVAPLPVAARGVAMASSLLSDGAGPLYNRQCQVDLVDAIRGATAELDASRSLLPV